MKVLCTGSREWDDIRTIARELQCFPVGTIVIHGGCRGADTACDVVARELGFETRVYHADWTKHHRAAGPRRNQQMIDSECPIDLCLAFHDDIESSKGTKDMMKRAKKAGIETRLIASSVEDAAV